MDDLDLFAMAAMPFFFKPDRPWPESAGYCYKVAQAMVNERDLLMDKLKKPAQEAEGKVGVIVGIRVRQALGDTCKGCVFDGTSGDACSPVLQRSAGFVDCILSNTVYIQAE